MLRAFLFLNQPTSKPLKTFSLSYYSLNSQFCKSIKFSDYE